jgi:mannose-6-phosphate isomerase
MEPGHHMEWAWLFTEVARVKGEPPHHLSESLALSALSLGLDPETGFLFGEVYEGGKVAVANVRLWPHGEWLKAAVRIPAISSTWRPALAAINRFLDVPVRGLWREQWLAERGGFAAGPAPASSLYHITTAITELRRVAKDARSVGTPLL